MHVMLKMYNQSAFFQDLCTLLPKENNEEPKSKDTSSPSAAPHGDMEELLNIHSILMGL